jgi:hypothetical protein
MKLLTNLKRSLFGLVLTPIALVAMGGTASAQIPYDGANTPASPVPAFNVFTGVPTVGNEADFFRSRMPVSSGDATTPYIDPLNANCVAGQKIQFRVYVHNGADKNGNNNGTGPSVAHGTNVKVTLPTAAADGFTTSARISSTNAGTVNDTATINCAGKTVKLKYVTGSASQYSIGTGVVGLSDDIIGSGVAISSRGVAGDVWGCWDERVYVVFTVEVEEVTPPAPVYTCDLLTVTYLSNRKYRFEVTYTANNGAVLKSTSVNYGDNSSAGTTLSSEHLYVADGTYNTSATLVFTVNNSDKTVTSDNCKKQVIVKGNECPTKPGVPVNDPSCKPCPTKPSVNIDSPECKCPTNPGMQHGDPKCKACPTNSKINYDSKECNTVKVLPSTGPAGLMALVAGVSGMCMIAHNVISRRKANR